MALWSDDERQVRGRVERTAAARRDAASRHGAAFARDLAFVAAFLAIVVVAGSVYGLAAGTRQKKLEREADRAQVAAELQGRASYTGIGTVRAKSADAKGAAVVVATIAFPFDSSDRSFAEELGRKAPVLKAVAVSVLSSKKAAELAPAFEGALKAALRDAFNARLSLGKVTEIWLSDFTVIQ
ncbi:MAG: flagellar basal body-associated FliL family protein [Rectinemataceae bacterium]|jgi:flagellar basal body-associated protein FliL